MSELVFRSYFVPGSVLGPSFKGQHGEHLTHRGEAEPPERLGALSQHPAGQELRANSANISRMRGPVSVHATSICMEGAWRSPLKGSRCCFWEPLIPGGAGSHPQPVPPPLALNPPAPCPQPHPLLGQEPLGLEAAGPGAGSP